jgi:hypothetical protein
MYLKPLNDILHIKFIKHNFLQYDSKYNNLDSPYIQEILHNTCPIFMKMHPCPLLNTKEHFFFKGDFEIT